MPKLVKGPYTVRWGANTIEGITDVSVNYDVTTNDYTTIQGTVEHTEGAIDANIELTLLYSDIPTLRVLFPQYYKAKGEVLSTGETVTSDDGAIDIVAAQCDTTATEYDLDLVSCAGEILRLKNARTRLSSVNLENSDVRTVGVTFLGRAASMSAIMQFLAAGEVES